MNSALGKLIQYEIFCYHFSHIHFHLYFFYHKCNVVLHIMNILLLYFFYDGVYIEECIHYTNYNTYEEITHIEREAENNVNIEDCNSIMLCKLKSF